MTAATRRPAGRPLVVGLTGGIGSGKSTVAHLFQELGVPVIDADVVAREVVSPGSPGLAAVVAAFGEEVLDAASGRLDRARLRELAFRTPAQRRLLESILHPLIRDRMRAHLAAVRAPYCIECVPLLVETGRSAETDRVLVVDVPPEVQVQRTLKRDGGERETVRRIMEAQATREQRLAAADDVLDNGGDPSGLRERVATLHRRYLVLAGADLPPEAHK